jgi:SP family galactose:H+ symporter-like MFS transporter
MAQGFPQTPVTPEHGAAVAVPEHARQQLLRWGAIGALGGFLFGYDTGVVSGALLFIKHDFDLGAFEQGAVVSILLLGAMIGAAQAGKPADRYGRRPTLLLIAAIYTVGIAVAAVAPSFGVLLGGRFVMGLGVGAASAIVPLYLSEVAPPAVRGRLVSMNQLMITIGIVTSYLVALIFAGSEDWRWMFAVGGVPSVLFLLGMLRAPETPSWLEGHGRADEARGVLRQVTDEDGVEEIMGSLRRAREQTGTRLGLGALLASRAARPALVIGVTLAALQQFGGINTIIYYSATIFENTGLNPSEAILGSLVIGVINVAMTLVSIRLVDKRGRRPLLRLSLTGMIVTLLLLGLTFALPIEGIDSWLSLACILLYISAFAIGMGPIFWLLIAEVFPAEARAEGAAVSSTTNWLANFVVGLVFLPVVQAIGEGPTFWIFAVICMAGLVFVNHYVPETRGRTFAEIDTELQARAGAPA